MIDSLRGGLIVSCQAYPGDPLRDPRAMSLIAMSAAAGGAAGKRAQGVEDITLIRELVALPLIGLLKVGEGDVFITPTLAHAIAVAEAGADIVAIDGTRRDRPDGLTLAETIRAIHETTGALVMADTGSLEDGQSAQDAGADIVGTTLAGYTGARPRTIGPDLELISEMATALSVPVFAEGRIRTPAQASEALDRGAYAVVVGTAITHPTSITAWYVDALKREVPSPRVDKV